MKVLPFKIPKPPNENIAFQIDEGPQFYGKLHQHEEIQLSYIIRGSGKLLVSDSVTSFEEGDIIVIDGNTPHLFQSRTDGEDYSKMYSLFFTRASFGQHFFELSELEDLKLFFNSLHAGFKLSAGSHQLTGLFNELTHCSKLRRLIILLELLQYLSLHEVEPLSGFKYKKVLTNHEGEKMQQVFEFVFNNFQHEISLDEVASLSYLTPNAFCRYFKLRTNKTFFQFITELRIEHACQLLESETEGNIADIAYQSGFKSITHFNRKFKQLKGVVPREYCMRQMG